MIFQKFFYIDISYTITVRHHKCVFFKIFTDTSDTSAGHRIQSGIYNCHLPWLQHIVVHNHFIFLCEIKGNVAVVKIIVCKPFFNDMLFISTANHKFIKSISRIHLHDMPENRFLPNLNHRLWFQMAFFTDSGTETTR